MSSDWIEWIIALLLYLMAIVEDGDACNDWLTHLPVALARVIEWIFTNGKGC